MVTSIVETYSVLVDLEFGLPYFLVDILHSSTLESALLYKQTCILLSCLWSSVETGPGISVLINGVTGSVVATFCSTLADL